LKPLPIRGATFATDGTYVRYDPAWAARVYADEPEALARDYLHTVLHNVFLHPFVGATVDAACWDAACDMVVEHTITELNLSATRCAREARQAAECAQVEAQVKRFTAEEVYRYLVQQHLDEEDLAAMRAPFLADDHAPWHQNYATENEDDTDKPEGEADEEHGARGAQLGQAGTSGTNMQMPPEAEQVKKAHKQHRGLSEDDIFKKKAPTHAHRAIGPRFADTVNLDRSRNQWEEAALELGVQLESYAKLWGTEGANLTMNLRRVTRKRTDYREFLRKFAVMGEHIQVNDDEFDYVYYCFGLRRYGNLPLVEPLEYAEARKIRDFVIAIDTSASTKDNLVRRFLEQTYSILSNETSFAAKMNVTILQCDAAITDVAHIKSRKEFDEYLENLKVKGLGGTDFRPVFAYVDDMLLRGEVTNLGGVIYFTDGHGTYPTRAPDYDVAFAFVDEIPEEPPVPTWAMKVQLEETDFVEDDE
ncbi:MAG: hypothetical protein J5804_02910, partial [Eggerthellaceae bacterium]|nr:hypothetical protein [Eggerthellaceae bacterium]